MRIAFRVDASQAIGLGHVRRCLSLAHALRAQGDEIRFVTRALGVDAPGAMAAEGHPVEVLAAPKGSFAPDPAIPHAQWGAVAWQQDAAETVAALRGFAPDWVVIDSYAFGAGWHRAVRDALGCRIAVIDDTADRALACDLLIDHNYAADHAVKYAGLLEQEPRLLGGPRFALLGPAFVAAAPYVFSPEVRSIGAFLGGVDAPNLSPLVLGAIDDAGFAGALEIVSTRVNPHLPALEAAVAARPDTTLSLDLPDLAAFFARHDLQVGAGGGASWERCRIGAPTLLLVTAENQRAVVPRLVEEGIVATSVSLARADVAREVAMLIADSSRRESLALRARALVDGRGATRVAEAMACG